MHESEKGDKRSGGHHTLDRRWVELYDVDLRTLQLLSQYQDEMVQCSFGRAIIWTSQQRHKCEAGCCTVRSQSNRLHPSSPEAGTCRPDKM